MVPPFIIPLGGSDWGSHNKSCAGESELSSSSVLLAPAAKSMRKPTVVCHDYHDFKDAPMETNEGHAAGSGQEPQGVRQRGATKQFPVKLYHILVKAQEEGFENVISWQPHGRCFIVRKPNIFTEKIMPRYAKRLSEHLFISH